ncbi:MAG: hypothetical protein ACAH80_05030 [Alphaproteobacteria bacterium]
MTTEPNAATPIETPAETHVEPEVKSVKAVLTAPGAKDILKVAFAVCRGDIKGAQQLVASHLQMSACDAEGKLIYGMSGKCGGMTIYTNNEKKEAGVETPAPAIKGLRL